MKLVVIIRDPAPLVLMNEPVGHRYVTLDLTPEQAARLQVRETGTSQGRPIHEEISFLFIQET